MRAFQLAIAIVLTSGVPAVAADVEASFLGASVYTTPADCPLYKRLAAGGPRNLSTVPETLTAKGYKSWEGGCRFTNVVERYKDRIWTVSMVCGEGAIESQQRTEVWRRQPDGSLTVTRDKTASSLMACATEKAPAPAAKKK
jgi:hypothetical protein